MSLWKVDLHHTLRSIVDAVLPTWSPADEGLLISLRLSMQVWGEDKRSEYRHVRILYQRQDNAIKVFVAAGSWPSWKSLNELEWENTSNHDSCWITDGIRPLSTLWGEMRKKIGGKLDSENTWIESVKRVNLRVESYEDEHGQRRWRPLEISVKTP